ncbi:hypothetical protein VP424E501_P0170 [Vibrio phage 424E50-1]|nr:hypothetical protein VP424E501_P0170 [Vibrio phage 424E50-1]
MLPIFRDKQSVLQYFNKYPWGECIIARGDKQVKCKGLKKAEKAMKKLKIT